MESPSVGRVAAGGDAAVSAAREEGEEEQVAASSSSELVEDEPMMFAAAAAAAAASSEDAPSPLSEGVAWQTEGHCTPLPSAEAALHDVAEQVHLFALENAEKTMDSDARRLESEEDEAEWAARHGMTVEEYRDVARQQADFDAMMRQDEAARHDEEEEMTMMMMMHHQGLDPQGFDELSEEDKAHLEEAARVAAMRDYAMEEATMPPQASEAELLEAQILEAAMQGREIIVTPRAMAMMQRRRQAEEEEAIGAVVVEDEDDPVDHDPTVFAVDADGAFDISDHQEEVPRTTKPRPSDAPLAAGTQVVVAPDDLVPDSEVRQDAAPRHEDEEAPRDVDGTSAQAEQVPPAEEEEEEEEDLTTTMGASSSSPFEAATDGQETPAAPPARREVPPLTFETPETFEEKRKKRGSFEDDDRSTPEFAYLASFGAFAPKPPSEAPPTTSETLPSNKGHVVVPTETPEPPTESPPAFAALASRPLHEAAAVGAARGSRDEDELVEDAATATSSLTAETTTLAAASNQGDAAAARNEEEALEDCDDDLLVPAPPVDTPAPWRALVQKDAPTLEKNWDEHQAAPLVEEEDDDDDKKREDAASVFGAAANEATGKKDEEDYGDETFDDDVDDDAGRPRDEIIQEEETSVAVGLLAEETSVVEEEEMAVDPRAVEEEEEEEEEEEAPAVEIHDEVVEEEDPVCKHHPGGALAATLQAEAIYGEDDFEEEDASTRHGGAHFLHHGPKYGGGGHEAEEEVALEDDQVHVAASAHHVATETSLGVDDDQRSVVEASNLEVSYDVAALGAASEVLKRAAQHLQDESAGGPLQVETRRPKRDAAPPKTPTKETVLDSSPTSVLSDSIRRDDSAVLSPVKQKCEDLTDALRDVQQRCDDLQGALRDVDDAWSEETASQSSPAADKKKKQQQQQQRVLASKVVGDAKKKVTPKKARDEDRPTSDGFLLAFLVASGVDAPRAVRVGARLRETHVFDAKALAALGPTSLRAAGLRPAEIKHLVRCSRLAVSSSLDHLVDAKNNVDKSPSDTAKPKRHQIDEVHDRHARKPLRSVSAQHRSLKRQSPHKADQNILPALHQHRAHSSNRAHRLKDLDVKPKHDPTAWAKKRKERIISAERRRKLRQTE